MRSLAELVNSMGVVLQHRYAFKKEQVPDTLADLWIEFFARHKQIRLPQSAPMPWTLHYFQGGETELGYVSSRSRVHIHATQRWQYDRLQIQIWAGTERTCICTVVVGLSYDTRARQPTGLHAQVVQIHTALIEEKPSRLAELADFLNLEPEVKRELVIKVEGVTKNQFCSYLREAQRARRKEIRIKLREGSVIQQQVDPRISEVLEGTRCTVTISDEPVWFQTFSHPREWDGIHEKAAVLARWLWSYSKKTTSDIREGEGGATHTRLEQQIRRGEAVLIYESDGATEQRLPRRLVIRPNADVERVAQWLRKALKEK